MTALGRLLSSQELREEYGKSPEKFARKIGLASKDIEAFIRLDVAEIHRQAEMLLLKRWHEVCKLIPATINALGDEGRELFRFYAGHHWPEGHRRHPLDALEFLRFLARNQILTPDRRELKRIQRMVSGR